VGSRHRLHTGHAGRAAGQQPPHRLPASDGRPVRSTIERNLNINEDELKALPDTKADAKEQGVELYYTGEPCGNGHDCERNVKTGCVECTKNREKRNAGGKQAAPKNDYQNFKKKNQATNTAFQKYSKNYQRGK